MNNVMLSVEYKFDLVIRMPYNYVLTHCFSDIEGDVSLNFLVWLCV